MDGSLSLKANDMVGNKSFETSTDDHHQTFPQADELYSDEDENFTVDRKEDVNSLLKFVNLAGDNIKASLDRSASCKRAVDHKKYLQKQLQHFSNSSQPLRSFGGPTYPPPGTASVRQQPYVKNKLDQYHCLNKRAIQAVNRCTPPLEHLHPNEQSDNSNKLNEQRKKLTCVKTVEAETEYAVPTSVICSSTGTLSMATESDSKVSDLKANTENDEETQAEEQDKAAEVDVEVTADLVLMDSLFKQSDNESGEKSSKSSSEGKKTVPLRQRSLPASFWKEPNNPQSTGCQNGRNGYSFMHCQPQFPAHTEEYSNSNFETLYRLPHGITNIPYHAPPSVHPSLTQFSSLKTTLATMEYPKHPLTIPYDEKITANLALSNDLTGRNYPYVLSNSSRILSTREYESGIAPLPQFHMHSVPMQSGLGHSLHPGRLHAQTCLDCCPPRHHHSLTPGIVQPTTYCRIPTVNSVLSHRPYLWKPIPTKSVSSFPSRYHPFAGVQ